MVVEVEVPVEYHGAARQRAARTVQAGEPGFLFVRIDIQHRCDQRRRRGNALQLEVRQHRAVGRALVIEAVKQHICDLPQQFAEAHARPRPQTHRQQIDAVPGHAGHAVETLPSRRNGNRQILGGSSPLEQGGEQGQDACHQAAAFRRCQLAQAPQPLRAQSQVDASAGITPLLRLGAVRRQLRLDRKATEALHPILQVVLAFRSGEEVALGLDIGGECGSRLQAVRSLGDAGVVQGRQLVNQQAAAPAVDRNMMEHQQQVVQLLRFAHQVEADQGSALQFEDSRHLFAFNAVQGGAGTVVRGTRQFDGNFLPHHQPGSTRANAGAQHIVTAQQLDNGVAQSVGIQAAAKAQGDTLVEGRSRFGMDLRRQPDLALRFGQRDTRLEGRPGKGIALRCRLFHGAHLPTCTKLPPPSGLGMNQTGLPSASSPRRAPSQGGPSEQEAGGAGWVTIAWAVSTALVIVFGRAVCFST